LFFSKAKILNKKSKRIRTTDKTEMEKERRKKPDLKYLTC